MAADALPDYADTVVIGAGTAGSAVAGLLAERGDQSVLLLEAGPDYGPRDSGRWPAELLDARLLPTSHDWGYDSGSTWAHRSLPFERARVVGGCSAHNGCAEIWGSRLDYDAWAALGNFGWSTDDLLPLFRAGAERLRVRRYATAEITPFQAACLAAAARAGLPLVDDLNDLDADVGMATSPVNIVDGVRWNAAFAYLDPVRGGCLQVAGDTLVDHLILRGGRAEGVAAVRNGARCTVRAGRVVLCGGAYGSPAVLLRSGVGATAELRELGIAARLELPGVGQNLHDHPVGGLIFAGTTELEQRMREFAAAHWTPEEQTIAKARSARCERGFDIHMFPIGGPAPGGEGWRWIIPFACMTPRSRGSVRLSGTDPNATLRIDHGYLSDPQGEDMQVMLDALELSRLLGAQPPIADLLGSEIFPGAATRERSELANLLASFCLHYAHPVGTCRMGPASQPESVAGADGKVHGLDNVYIADAALMPVIPRANTNMPTLVVALRVVQGL